MQTSPLLNRCSSMPGARLTAALTPPSCLPPSQPASPQAERSALHLVGPQYSLVELKRVLHARSLYPSTWGGAHHKGLSMEPLMALNWSLAHRPPAPPNLSGIDAVDLPTLFQSAHLSCRWYKGQSWVGGRGPRLKSDITSPTNPHCLSV